MPEKKIFYGGTIISMDQHNTIFESVGIEGKRIVGVGSFNEVKSNLQDAEIINLDGKVLLPGFHDCHCHPIPYIFFFINLNLGNIKSYKEFQETLQKTVIQREPKEWIFGLDYNELNFEDKKKLPDRWELDKISPENPVFILRFDGHIGIANSKALEIVGIDETTIPPEGSEYRKNNKGKLTGVITEKAIGKIISQYALPSMEQIEKGALKAFGRLVKYGITSVHGTIHFDAGGEMGDIGLIEVPIMKSILDKILPNWYSLVYTKNPKKIKRIKKPPLDGGTKDSKFKIGGIKLFIDGSLGASTAWMHEPFSDHPDKSGFCVYDNVEDLYNQMVMAHNFGFQIGVHAIGDKGNRVLVDLYKRLLNEYPREDHRHRVEHASLLTSDVIEDMKDLKLIASIQPPFITTDAKLADYRLGHERSKYTYPFKSLLDAGVVCASGSDCPVEDPDVIWGLHALVNRNGFIPEQCISIEEALKTYTINGAYAAFEEEVKGSIEVGKLADFVILDKNPLKIPKDEIKNILVLETIIRGKTVYKRN